MLVISQKKGDKIHIGRDITVTLVDIKANKVRLGIEAPNHLTILRDQLYQQEVEPELTESSPKKFQSRAPEPKSSPYPRQPQHHDADEDKGEDC